MMTGRPAPASSPRAVRQRGFSLLELSVAVLVIGVMAGSAYVAYGDRAGGRSAFQSLARGEQLSQAIRTFALHHHRLPCPDTSGEGHEGDAGGTCPAGVEMGWVPYASLGLDRPAPSAREIYAVYRNAAQGADLVAPAAAPVRNDLIRSLVAAAAQPTGTSHVFVTGEGNRTGPENCGSNAVMHPAFAVVIPNADADGDGQMFDGVHAGLPASGLCLASPRSPARNGYDDAVAVTGLSTLIGLALDDVP